MLEKENGNNEDSKFNANEGQSTDSDEEEETASDSSQSQESENSDQEAESEIEAANSDSESTSFVQEKDLNPCQHCEGLNVYHTAVMTSPKCFLHDNREMDTRMQSQYSYSRRKEEIDRCFDCGAVTNYNPKKSKESFYPPKEGDN